MLSEVAVAVKKGRRQKKGKKRSRQSNRWFRLALTAADSLKMPMFPLKKMLKVGALFEVKTNRLVINRMYWPQNAKEIPHSH